MFYYLATKCLNKLPPEFAHNFAINMLRYFPVKNVLADLDLQEFSQTLMGYSFPHPLGLAAGFDKHAEVFDKIGALGFSFLEVGSVTPKPQSGNSKPRLFRLPESKAIINRYGFNSKGLAYFNDHLQKYRTTCIIGVNLGKNKDTVDACEDFLQSAEVLINQADYFTINVSSPNTAGLRDLQNPQALKPIIEGIRTIGLRKQKQVPIFIKISPDMSLEQESALIEFLLEQPITGLVISNTTINRDSLKASKWSQETGGLSGPPLTALSTFVLQRIARKVQKRLLLIGCGGISSGQDAYDKLCAGADLLQLYTAFIYEGPFVLRKILLELKAILAREGVENIREIIGSKN